nr:inorganic pyrophosphatase [Anaerocolumna chitinilytica]
MGTTHPKHSDIFYEVNYGYVDGIIAGDGAEQDIYLLGVDEPVSRYEGVVIAVIHRNNDIEDKWVVAPQGKIFSNEEILEKTMFQEKYFDTELYR